MVRKIEVPVWHLAILAFAFLVVSHGRSLLFEYMINHGHIIQHHGVWSLIVWFTSITSLVFMRYKLFCASILHYAAFHVLIVMGVSVGAGRALGIMFFLGWLAVFDTWLWRSGYFAYRHPWHR